MTLLDYPLLLGRPAGEHTVSATIAEMMRGYFILIWRWGIIRSITQTALVVNNSWGIAGGFYLHPTKRMQALYFDGHAKSTKFSQTLGTGDSDEQWAFTKDRLADVNAARKALQNDPKVQAVYQ